jgi:outer membrane protein TolC
MRHQGFAHQTGTLATWGGLCVFLVSCLAVISLQSCSPQYYKSEADEEVYGIIDDKWDPGFGPKTNYRIADAPAEPNGVRDKPQVPASGMLRLTDAAVVATTRNREYQRQKEELYLTALRLTLARHTFEPQFLGILGGDYARNDRQESVSADGKVGLSQLLADGAAISSSIAVDWAQFLTGDPRTSLGSVLSATVTQPLLRASTRKVVQENLTQAERNALYQLRSFSRYRKTFVVSVVSQYYRLLQAMDTVKNAENNYKNLIEAQERVKWLADAGRLPRFQVDQAEQDRLRAWDGFVGAQQRYKTSLDEFKMTLALPVDAEIGPDPNELAGLAAIEVAEPNFAVAEAVDTALVHRLDLANVLEQVEDAERKVLVVADSLKADLDLVGSLSVGSEEPTKFQKLQFHRGLYSLGLELDLPLERKAQRNAYREALITLMRSRRQYEQEADRVKLQVRQAFRGLEETATKHRIRSKSLQLAEMRVDSTSLLLQAGRATTRDVLESQGALLEAQNNKTAALIDHAIAKLEFYRDIDILQVRPDGMWEQQKYASGQEDKPDKPTS